MRRFSSYGPIDPKLHYHAPRKKLIDNAAHHLQGTPDAEGGHYITREGTHHCSISVKHESTQASPSASRRKRSPPPLGSWLINIGRDSASMVSGETQAELNRLWKADVLPFCHRATHDRYPFIASGSAETPLKDFGQLFGPNGDLDRFFTENFSAAVDTTTAPWRWVGEGQGISKDALAQFETASAIRESFFSGGTPGLAVSSN